MRQLPSYSRLLLYFLVGIGFVGGGVLLKLQNVSLASWSILLGLSVQAVVGMIIVYKFAKSKQSEQE